MVSFEPLGASGGQSSQGGRASFLRLVWALSSELRAQTRSSSIVELHCPYRTPQLFNKEVGHIFFHQGNQPGVDEVIVGGTQHPDV